MKGVPFLSKMVYTVADPDLHIGWGGHGLQKKCFWPFEPQFGAKIRGSPAPPLDPPPVPLPGLRQILENVSCLHLYHSINKALLTVSLH